MSAEELQAGSGSDNEDKFRWPSPGQGRNKQKKPKKAAIPVEADRKNPQYIPRQGSYWAHELRTGQEDDQEKSHQKREDTNRKSDDLMWTHDKYDPHQESKTDDQIIAEYGYNIRNDMKCPSKPLPKQWKGRDQNYRSNVNNRKAEYRRGGGGRAFVERGRGRQDRGRGEWRGGGRGRGRGRGGGTASASASGSGTGTGEKIEYPLPRPSRGRGGNRGGIRNSKVPTGYPMPMRQDRSDYKRQENEEGDGKNDDWDEWNTTTTPPPPQESRKEESLPESTEKSTSTSPDGSGRSSPKITIGSGAYPQQKQQQQQQQSQSQSWSGTPPLAQSPIVPRAAPASAPAPTPPIIDYPPPAAPVVGSKRYSAKAGLTPQQLRGGPGPQFYQHQQPPIGPPPPLAPPPASRAFPVPPVAPIYQPPPPTYMPPSFMPPAGMTPPDVGIYPPSQDVTYYPPGFHTSHPRNAPVKRPNAAIPIVQPPEEEKTEKTSGGGTSDEDQFVDAEEGRKSDGELDSSGGGMKDALPQDEKHEE